MKLRERQVLFARLVPRLIDHAFELGFEVTFGEAYRMPVQAEINSLGRDGRRGLADVVQPYFPRLSRVLRDQVGGGIRNSLHNSRLAVDLNLFRDGVYLSSGDEHTPLGEWWEEQHELCVWGGHFDDGNHYSITYNGAK